jgi:hypothetical protein
MRLAVRDSRRERVFGRYSCRDQNLRRAKPRHTVCSIELMVRVHRWTLCLPLALSMCGTRATIAEKWVDGGRANDAWPDEQLAPDAPSEEGCSDASLAPNVPSEESAADADLAPDALYVEGVSDASLVSSSTCSGAAGPVSTLTGLCSAPNSSMAVDATNVYCTVQQASADLILKIPADGSGAPTVLASVSGFCSGVAVDATRVYWSSPGACACDIWSVPIAGGPPTRLVQGQEVGTLAVGGGRVYWGGTGALMSVPQTGGTPTSVALIPSPATGLIAFNGTSVYWVVSSNAGVVEVFRVDTSVGERQLLTSYLGVGTLSAMAADASNVYWTTRDGPNCCAVYKVPIAGGAPTVLAPADWPLAIAVDAMQGQVYWADLYTGAHLTSGGIYRVSESGGPLCEMSIASPSGELGVNATGIYWLSSRGLMRMGRN